MMFSFCNVRILRAWAYYRISTDGHGFQNTKEVGKMSVNESLNISCVQCIMQTYRLVCVIIYRERPRICILKSLNVL